MGVTIGERPLGRFGIAAVGVGEFDVGEGGTWEGSWIRSVCHRSDGQTN